MTNLDFYRVQKLDYIVSKFEPQSMKKAPEIVHQPISSPNIEPLTAVYAFPLVQILDTLLIYQVYGCMNYTENRVKTHSRHLHVVCNRHQVIRMRLPLLTRVLIDFQANTLYAYTV